MNKIYITLLALAFCLNGKAQTTIPGGYVYGTWTLAGSPYLIQGSLEVPNDSTLTIQPGVTVNFQGHYKLIVLGRLLAIGTQTDSIFFTTSNTTTGWYGIRFDSTTANNDTSKISYCDLQWGIANGSGNDDDGGAIMLYYFSKVIISNCFMQNNKAGLGAAISGYYSSAIILNNNISNNSGSGSIYLYGGNSNISSNIITYNNGDGIEGGSNSTIIYNNIISHNNGIGISGGGIISYNTITYNDNYSWGGGIVGIGGMPLGTIISHNIISYNTTDNGGYSAGIGCYGCGILITDNIISNNSSPAGPGINICGGGPFTPTITNNVIVNNTATGPSGAGGGINFSGSGNYVVANNTIANNSAINGGGIYIDGSTTSSFYNCIIYGNEATTSGNQIFMHDQTTQPNFYYCDIQGGQASLGLNGNFYSGTYTNNINADPLFVSPSADTGISFDGVSANWSLQSTSPCNNTGDPVGTYPGTYPATDIAGNPRVIGSTINMGAYEQQIATGIIKNTNNNELNIYPNPNNGSFVIEPQNTLYNVHCIVYDVNGKTVLSQVINGKTTIDASGLNEGVYNISIIGNEGTINKRIVIVK
jgi:type IX secretion system substrate protein/parallel beta helix pectate lyase-like protein